MRLYSENCSLLFCETYNVQHASIVPYHFSLFKNQKELHVSQNLPFKKIKSTIIIFSLILSGCSAIAVKPEANLVSVVTEEAGLKQCKFLGEIAGSQGNWITGGYTADKDLMIGARNALKNAAYDLGGDTVYLQQTSSSGRYMASGLSNATLIGKAYKCNDQRPGS